MSGLEQEVRNVLRGVVYGQADERVSLGMRILAPALEALGASRAQDRLAAVLSWMERTEAETTAWLETHNPECGCEVGEARLNLLAELRFVVSGSGSGETE